jgi:hypothetical protein
MGRLSHGSRFQRLTDQKLAAIGVLLAVLVSGLVMMPYKTWRKRMRVPHERPSPYGPRPTGATRA